MRTSDNEECLDCGSEDVEIYELASWEDWEDPDVTITSLRCICQKCGTSWDDEVEE